MTQQSTLRKIARSQEELKDLRRRRDEAKGALDQLQREMRTIGYPDLESLDAAISELEASASRDEAALEKAWGDFREKWGDELRSDRDR